MSLLDRAGLTRPELRAWALYDWANSADGHHDHHRGVPHLLRLGGGGGARRRRRPTRRFALATATGLVLTAILAPVLGALADLRPWKKRLLGAFVALGASSTVGAVVFVGPG